ncbi:MAG TPA: MarR family transcriptional regulator [Planctomycetota bacterium]|nr:MarR family transcriptional regulator [Planctomycetota bacterium]
MTDESGSGELAIQAVAETIGQLVEFWGFKRIMGRLWTVVYLSPEPLSVKDLAQRLQVSVSLVSMTVNELLQWGCLRRALAPGSRADLYEAETNLWKMLSKVLKERETFRLEDAIERLSTAKASIGKTTAPKKRLVGRIEKLERLAMVVKGLVAVLVEDGQLDVTGLRDISLGDD